MAIRSPLDFAPVETRMARCDFDGAHARLEQLAAAAASDADRVRVDFTRAALLVQEGAATEACEIFARLIARHPDRRDFWRSYLMALKASQLSDAAFVGAHRLYGSRFIDDEALREGSHLPKPATRLHIGYLGPDGHIAILRFLRHLPHSRHRGTFLLRDPQIARGLQKKFPTIECLTLPASDRDACSAIRDAGIDVIVDLCGHGPGGALDVLARRPAPLQVTWLDYLSTTGLPAIDYRITDWIADPPGNEWLHTEDLARLPFAAWCYEPSAEAPEITPPFGPLVVGSACIPLKMNEPTLALWRRTLEALPYARFELVGFLSTSSRERVLQALGPDVATRTTLHGRLPMPSYLALVDRFHIALDASGFSGATSTLDCLWQGVPVITLPGKLSHSRSSASLLEHVGLGRFIARSTEHYVAIANEAARETFDRAGLRKRLSRTPLCDPVKFARGFDDLIASLWSQKGLADGVQSPRELALEKALAQPLDAELRRNAFHALRSASA